VLGRPSDPPPLYEDIGVRNRPLLHTHRPSVR